MDKPNPLRTGGPDARRRFVRVAFGVPAVMTLTTGRAIAASSSLRCLAATPNPGADAVISTSADAMYQRVRLYEVQGHWNDTSGSKKAQCVRGADLKSIADFLGGTSYMTSLQYQWINDDGTLDGGLRTLDVTKENKQDALDKWIVVRFEVQADGNIGVVGVGGTGDGNVATNSCWNSFNAA